MPQLVPFYFINLIFWGLLTIFILLWVITLLILPHILKCYISRLFISKL